MPKQVSIFKQTFGTKHAYADKKGPFQKANIRRVGVSFLAFIETTKEKTRIDVELRICIPQLGTYTEKKLGQVMQ
jgi:hypothetical protein